MDNGLMINEEEFMKLPQREKLCLLYKNQVATMKMIQGYKFYYKLTTIIGSVLIIGMGILFKMHLT